MANDTLVGYRQRDTEGPVPEVATFAIPLDDIARLSVRGVDWYRTSLVGGGVIAGVLAASLARKSGDSGGGTTSGGGKPVPE